MRPSLTLVSIGQLGPPDRVLSCQAPHFFVAAIVGVPLSAYSVLLVTEALPVGEKQALAFAAV